MYEKPTIIDKIGRAITIAGNALMMNLCFLLFSIPIVTIGQAWCGLLSAIRYNIRGDKWTTGFWKGFKTRFVRGTIVWCVMGAIDVYFLLDVIHCFSIKQANPEASVVPLVFACLVFLLMAMVTFAFQLLNVYVPTRFGDWLSNSVNMVFKVPLELAIAAVAFWLPALAAFLWPALLWYAAMIVIIVYFVLVATAGTLMMKNALIQYLVDARAEGILIADDGKKKETDEEA